VFEELKETFIYSERILSRLTLLYSASLLLFSVNIACAEQSSTKFLSYPDETLKNIFYASCSAGGTHPHTPPKKPKNNQNN